MLLRCQLPYSALSRSLLLLAAVLLLADSLDWVGGQEPSAAVVSGHYTRVQHCNRLTSTIPTTLCYCYCPHCCQLTVVLNNACAAD